MSRRRTPLRHIDSQEICLTRVETPRNARLLLAENEDAYPVSRATSTARAGPFVEWTAGYNRQFTQARWRVRRDFHLRREMSIPIYRITAESLRIWLFQIGQRDFVSVACRIAVPARKTCAVQLHGIIRRSTSRVDGQCGGQAACHRSTRRRAGRRSDQAAADQEHYTSSESPRSPWRQTSYSALGPPQSKASRAD